MRLKQGGPGGQTHHDPCRKLLWIARGVITKAGPPFLTTMREYAWGGAEILSLNRVPHPVKTRTARNGRRQKPALGEKHSAAAAAQEQIEHTIKHRRCGQTADHGGGKKLGGLASNDRSAQAWPYRWQSGPQWCELNWVAQTEACRGQSQASKQTTGDEWVGH